MTRRSLLVLTALLAALLAVLPAARPARAGVDRLELVLQRRLQGGLAVAATCVNHADPAAGGPNGGVLELDELPADAAVQEAWLYWSVLSDATPVPTGSPTLDGALLQWQPVAEIERTPCFNQLRTGTFKAEVTALIGGNGSYRLAGLPGSGTNLGDLTEGATLFVLYCSGSGVETDVVLYEGVDVTERLGDPFNQAIGGFLAAPVGPVTARLALAAGNGQSRDIGDPDPFLFNGVDLDELDPTILSGALCPPNGLYDRTVLDVTGLVEPGATSATLEALPEGDCHSFAALALAVATEPAPLGEPSALDLRPGTPPLRVAKAAGELAFEWEELAPGTTYHLYRGSLGAYYDHGPFGACGLAEARARRPDEPGDFYFLAVAAGCGGADSSAGRASTGANRPGALEASGASCP